MLHQTFLFLGQLWQLFEVSQILEFLRYQEFLRGIHLFTFDIKFAFFALFGSYLCQCLKPLLLYRIP